MNLTIDKLAKFAGVSKTTVSRVLNDKPDVSPKTRAMIKQLIEEHGFQPNAFATSISSQKSNNIGLIIPYQADYIFSNPFYVEVMRGVSTEVDRRGYYLLLCYPHDQNYVDIYRQKRVDGFILMSPGSLHRSIIDSLKEVNAPFVSTAKMTNEKGMVYVDVDNTGGARLAVEHLVNLGHRSIAFIGKPTLTSSLDRFHGYKAVLAEHGLPFDEKLVVVAETSSIESGHTAMSKLLSDNPGISAAFLTNDIMAMGAIKAIKEHGKRTPRDVSIVGFDDIPMAMYNNPPLTTVRQPAFEKGIKAAQILVKYLESGVKPRSQVLKLDLVVRESTAILSK